jgi:hypothetical protein
MRKKDTGEGGGRTKTMEKEFQSEFPISSLRQRRLNFE